MRNQDVRLWIACIMEKFIMSRERANKDMVVISSAMILTRMARKMHLVGRSKSRGKKDIQCHFYDKFGHLKKDCYAWKREKGKSKDKGSSSALEDKPKSLVKINKLNVVTHTSDS